MFLLNEKTAEEIKYRQREQRKKRLVSEGGARLVRHIFD